MRSAKLARETSPNTTTHSQLQCLNRLKHCFPPTNYDATSITTAMLPGLPKGLKRSASDSSTPESYYTAPARKRTRVLGLDHSSTSPAELRPVAEQRPRCNCTTNTPRRSSHHAKRSAPPRSPFANSQASQASRRKSSSMSLRPVASKGRAPRHQPSTAPANPGTSTTYQGSRCPHLPRHFTIWRTRARRRHRHRDQAAGKESQAAGQASAAPRQVRARQQGHDRADAQGQCCGRADRSPLAPLGGDGRCE